MSNNYPQLKYGIGVRPKQDLKDKRKRGRYFWQFDYVGHKRHIYVTCPNCGKVNDISKHEIDSNGKSKQVRTSWGWKERKCVTCRWCHWHFWPRLLAWKSRSKKHPSIQKPTNRKTS